MKMFFKNPLATTRATTTDILSSDKFWSEKLTSDFGSGELNRELPD